MHDFLSRLGIEPVNSGCWLPNAQECSGRIVESVDPSSGQVIAKVQLASVDDYERLMVKSQAVFKEWRTLPAPKRGDIVREMGNAMRDAKEDLGRLVTLEVGKVLQEGLGEVQESIDIADFAVGQSRMLYGLTMHSERPGHRMYEQWHPMGVVGVISAFNFPNAVWAWNAMLAAISGDTVVWKPSLKAPLTAIATHKICNAVLEKHGFGGVFTLIIGEDAEVGETLINDKRVPLISATGSTRMGRHVGTTVAKRLGRSLLELGGNNAIIVEPDADLDLALTGVLFGAVGTAGQRCTTTRRLYLHEDIAQDFTQRLVKAYGQVRIGDALAQGTLMGPLIDQDAVDMYANALDKIREEGGEILAGGKRLDRPGFFVEPALVRATEEMEMWREETFAPILYVFTYSDLDAAIDAQNSVVQGLSSSIFTGSFRSSEAFLSAAGSDCGIANVNIGTSGAEIGGAFGGEKETGGGRESGSDSWKAYMRRQTCTLNYSKELPLAQGISFDI